jgi:hypothetical protein
MADRKVTVQVDVNGGGNLASNLTLISDKLREQQKQYSAFPSALNTAIGRGLDEKTAELRKQIDLLRASRPFIGSDAHTRLIRTQYELGADETHNKALAAEHARLSIGSPEHVRLVKEQLQLQKEEAKNAKAERLVGLQAQYGKVGAKLISMGDGFSKIARQSEIAFAAMTAGITGFVAAASPETLETFGKSIQILAARIGLNFVPYAANAIKAVQALDGWVSSLDESTKEGAARWAMYGLAVAGSAMIAKRVIGIGGWVGANPGISAAMGIAAATAVQYEIITQMQRRAEEQGGRAASNQAQNAEMYERLRQEHARATYADYERTLPENVRRQLANATPQERQRILEQQLRQAQAAVQHAEMANRPGAQSGLEQAFGLEQNQSWWQNSTHSRMQRIGSYLATLDPERLNSLIGARFEGDHTTPEGRMRRAEQIMAYLAPMLGVTLDTNPLGVSPTGGQYIPSTGHPFTGLLGGNNMSPEDIQRAIRIIIGEPSGNDQRGVAELIQNILRNGVPGMPNFVINPQTNRPYTGPGGQPITRESAMAMVSPGAFQSQQFALEGLHDMIQREIIRSPQDQQLWDLQQQGWRLLIDALQNQGGFSSFLNSLFGRGAPPAPMGN